MDAFVLKLTENTRFSDDELFEFCVANRDLRIERDQDGNLIIMSPTGSRSSYLNARILTQLGIWCQSNSELGVYFGPDGGFILPKGSMRAPDAAWLSMTKWESLTKKAQSKFLPIAPDFVIEVKSPSDSIGGLKKKMEEWIDNGVRLGWLIDPDASVSYIYRNSQAKETAHPFKQPLDGEDVLPGFRLDLSKLKV